MKTQSGNLVVTLYPSRLSLALGDSLPRSTDIFLPSCQNKHDRAIQLRPTKKNNKCRNAEGHMLWDYRAEAGGGGKCLSDFRGPGAGMCEATWQAIHFHDCGINSADRARRRVAVAPRALVPAPLRSDLARYARCRRVFNAHFAR